MARKPHIILIVSDQHNRRLLGCAGNEVVRTPGLDRLAGEGVLFRSSYAPSPLCVPSRMAMLSGLRPTTTGIHRNSQTLPSHVPTLAHSLAAAGYRTVLCGRMHFVGPDQRHGFRERLVGDHGPTGTAHTEAAMGVFDGTTGQDGRALRMSGAGWSTVQAFDEAVTLAAIQRINAQDLDHPLFMTVGFYGPHNPYVCSEEQFAHYGAALEPLTEEYIQQWRQRDHPAMRSWREARRLNAADLDALNRARVAYHGAVETVDANVEAIVSEAERRLGPENCLFVYVSDHGDMAGERGLFWKSTFYEGSVGSAWLMRWAGVLPVQEVDVPTSLLDLGPTLTSLVDAPAMPGAQGTDYSRYLLSAARPREKDVFSTLYDRACGPSAMIRRGSWKLIAHPGHARPELYDLAGDPREQHDRAEDPSCREKQDELAVALRRAWDPHAVASAGELAEQQLRLMRAAHEADAEDIPERWQADISSLYLQ